MYWLGWVVMTLMIGLRFHVGVDYGNYFSIWQYAGDSTLPGFWHAYPGDTVFYGYVWVLRQSGLGFWALTLSAAVFFTTGLFRYARIQPNPWLALSVAVPYLVIVVAMSGMRQAIALGFVFLGLTAYCERRNLAFVAWTACGALFHASAIVMFGFVGLSFARNRFQAGLILAVTVVFAYYVLGSTFNEYSRDYLGKTPLDSSGTPYRIAMSVLSAAIFFLLQARMQITPSERSFWRNSSIFALASIPALFVVPSSTALDRLLIYIFPLQIGVLSHTPFVASKVQNERRLTTMGILLYLGATLFVFLFYAANRQSWLPYRLYPIWEGQ